MTRLTALLLLVWNFLRSLVLAAWTTSVTIVTAPGAPRRQFARLAYGDLDETAAVWLAALVTLTPGTSTIDIDPERRELVLHVLDTGDIEAILDALRRDFVRPLTTLFGGSRR